MLKAGEALHKWSLRCPTYWHPKDVSLRNADRGTIVLTAYKKLLYETKALVHITEKLSCVLSEQPKYLGFANVILKYFPWHRPVKTYVVHISQYHRRNKVPSYKLVGQTQSSSSSIDICFIFK